MGPISMKLTTFTLYSIILKAGSKLQYFNVKCIIEGLETTGGEREISKRGGAIISSYGWLWTFMAPATDFQTHG